MAKVAAGRKARARASSKGASIANAIVAREAGGFLLLGVVAGIAAALWSYDARDAVFELTRVNNAVGALGATVAGLLMGLAGAASWGIVGALAGVAAQLVTGGRVVVPRRIWVATAVSFAAVATLASILPVLSPARFAGLSGGWVGGILAGVESALLSAPGAIFLNALLLAVGIAGYFGVPAGEALASLGRGGVAASHVAGRVAIAFGSWARGAGLAAFAAGEQGFTQLQVWRERRARRERVAETREELAGGAPALPAEATQIAGEPAADASADAPAEASAPMARGRAAAPAIVDHARERKQRARAGGVHVRGEHALGPYEPPDIARSSSAPPENARRYDRESLIMNSRILEKKLADFGVLGRVVTVHPGPVITMYEFEPAPGVKVNRIVNLVGRPRARAARALGPHHRADPRASPSSASRCRTREREVVYIRDLLEARVLPAERESKLTLALGKDIFGNPVEADLASMPHLLVAGATGTGKSVFLNSLLCSILVPRDARRGEAAAGRSEAARALDLRGHPAPDRRRRHQSEARGRGAAAASCTRWRSATSMMAALGVRNIEQFNARVDEAMAAGQRTFRLKPEARRARGARGRVPAHPVHRRRDRRARRPDGRVGARRRGVAAAARADGARRRHPPRARDAASERRRADRHHQGEFPGAHLVPGLVAHRLAHDPRPERCGAPARPGRHALPAAGHLEARSACTAPSSPRSEVAELVAHSAPPGRAEVRRDADPADGEESEEKEERGDDVDEHVRHGRSRSSPRRATPRSPIIQRRLKVGYNRAARMIEQMEPEGVVGPQEGTKPREVFVGPIGEDPDARREACTANRRRSRLPFGRHCERCRR